MFLLASFGVCSNAMADVDVEVKGSTRVAYDDNVTFQHDPVSDIITSMNAGIGLKAEGSRYGLNAAASITHHIYSDNSSFDNTEFDTAVDGHWDFSERDRLKFSDSYTHAEDPRSFEDAFGRENGRYTYDRNGFKLRYDRDLNAHLSAYTHYDQALNYYSRNDLSDSIQHTVGGGVEYAIDSADIVGLGYDYAKRFFTPGPEIAVNSIFGTYRRYFTTQLYLDAKVGSDFIDSESRGHDSRLRTEISLTSDVDENTRAGISFRKGLSTSSYSQNLFDSYQFSAQWARQLTRRINAGFNAFYGKGEYQVINIRDRSLGAGVGASYSLTAKSTIGLNYTYSDTESNVSSRSYKRNYVQLGMQVHF
jgi:opacity protein-like surface antigen